MGVPQKLKVESPHDLAIPLLAIYPKKTLTENDICASSSWQHYLQ